MSEYQKGRVAAVHHVGVNVEDISEAYEKELPRFDVAKQAYATSSRAIEELQSSFVNELKGNKYTLREAELVKFYLGKSIELLNALQTDTESRKQQTIGALDAFKKSIAVIKRIYDEENTKLTSLEEWNNNESKDVRLRPPGAYPGNPIKEMKKQAEAQLRELENQTTPESTSEVGHHEKQEPEPQIKVEPDRVISKRGRPGKSPKRGKTEASTKGQKTKKAIGSKGTK